MDKKFSKSTVSLLKFFRVVIILAFSITLISSCGNDIERRWEAYNE